MFKRRSGVDYDTTLRDIYFRCNDLLAVSSFYPGLELATTGVHWLTGLPLVGAQILVFCWRDRHLTRPT